MYIFRFRSQATWSLAQFQVYLPGRLQYFLRLLVFSVRQENLVKDVTVCQDVRMSEYKVRHPDDSEDPQDVGLSSEDKATGMEEVTGIACRIVPSRPSPVQLAPSLPASRSSNP